MTAVFKTENNDAADDDEEDDDGGFANRSEPELDERGYVVRSQRVAHSNSVESTRGRAAINALGNTDGRSRDSSRPGNDSEEETEERMYNYMLQLPKHKVRLSSCNKDTCR